MKERLKGAQGVLYKAAPFLARTVAVYAADKSTETIRAD